MLLSPLGLGQARTKSKATLLSPLGFGHKPRGEGKAALLSPLDIYICISIYRGLSKCSMVLHRVRKGVL